MSVKDAKHLFGQGRWPCAEFEGAEPSKKRRWLIKKGSKPAADHRPSAIADSWILDSKKIYPISLIISVELMPKIGSIECPLKDYDCVGRGFVFFVGSWLHSPHPSNQSSDWTIVIWVGAIWRFGDCFNVAKFSSCPPAFLRNDTSNLLPRVATQRGRLPLVAKTLQATLPLCIPPLPYRWQDRTTLVTHKTYRTYLLPIIIAIINALSTCQRIFWKQVSRGENFFV